MIQPLTETELAEMKVRADAATPPPWVTQGYPYVVSTFQNERKMLADCSPHTNTKIYYETCQHNADFLANARQDVPRLIAEVHRLRAKLASHGVDPDQP